jgi:hypothetical protein
LALNGFVFGAVRDALNHGLAQWARRSQALALCRRHAALFPYLWKFRQASQNFRLLARPILLSASNDWPQSMQIFVDVATGSAGVATGSAGGSASSVSGPGAIPPHS